jgi:CRP-like cAMP-binding protein
MTEILDTLRNHPFLAGISPHHVEQLVMLARPAAVAGHTRIFDEGGHADRFRLILDGHVRLDIHVPGRGDVTVETLGPGSVLGWSWLFAPYRWHLTATAVDDVRCVEFDGPAVRRLCEDDPSLGFRLTLRFMWVVVRRLQHTRLRLIDAYAPGQSGRPT